MAIVRVVIVDDEPSLIKFVSQNLRARGYDVADAANGLEGVERVKEYKPDLVILDINMPGMDGFEACSYIRQFSDAAIIMLTATCGAPSTVMRPSTCGSTSAGYGAKSKMIQPIRSTCSPSPA